MKENNVIWTRGDSRYECKHPDLGLIALIDEDDTVGFKEPCTVQFVDAVGDTVFLSLNDQSDPVLDWSHEGRLKHAINKVKHLKSVGYEDGVYCFVGRFSKTGKYRQSTYTTDPLSKGEQWFICYWDEKHSPVWVKSLGGFDSHEKATNHLKNLVIQHGMRKGNNLPRSSLI